MADNFVITIARGFGSGGKQSASMVARNLGIHCYENRILTLAAEKSGYDRTRFLEADERLAGKGLANAMRYMQRTLNPKPQEGRFTSDLHLFECEAEIIRELADNESCVIVGKCADHVLRGRENVYSFYIEAPRAFCVKRIMERMGVGEAEAHRLISKTDKYRADYYKYYTGGNYWTNPVNYDMTLNSDKVGMEECIVTIENYVKMQTARRAQKV